MSTVKIDHVLKAAIGVLLGVLVFVLYTSIRERVIVVGDSAPEFSIKTDDGRTVTTSNFGGRLLVLNFWASWCAPCVEEMPSLNEFSKQLAKSGVVVLAVSVDKDAKAYRNFLSRANVSFLTARDPEAKINADYGTFKYPESYIIDAKGTVLEKFVGPADWVNEKVLTDVKSLL